MAKRRKPAKTGRCATIQQAVTPADVAAVREEIDRLVRAHAIAMVESTIDEVKQGRYLAMRFLFEMTGIYPVPAAENSPGQGETLAQTLLERLGLLSNQELESLDSTACGHDDNAVE